MAERLLGPDLNSRLVYVPAGGALLSAVGETAIVYAAASGGALADIRAYDGTSVPGAAIAGSQLTVNSDSMLPLFWFPSNTDTVYVEVNGGTRTPVNADYDARIDAVGGHVNSPLMSTGVVSGGTFTVNGANPKAIDIAPLVGYVVDYATNPASPTITQVRTTTTQTVELSAAGQARNVTFWLMDSSGTVIQQATPPTNTQRRTHLQLGSTAYDIVSGAIYADQSTPVILSQVVNQLYDLMYSLGAFSVSGNVISANGANLSFNKTSGTMFVVGFNHVPTVTDPHVSPLAAQTPVQFRHYTQLVSTTLAPLTTTLDVANYDNGGVITPIGGGANSATNFRILLLGQNTTVDQVVVQYGQLVYASLSAAVAGLHRGTFILNPAFTRAAALVGFISVTRTATDLSDPAQATFTHASKFDIP